MTLPIPIGIQDENYKKLYGDLNSPQRQVNVIISALVGGVFGGCVGAIIGIVWKTMGSNLPDIIQIWISLGIIQGVCFLGQLSGVPYFIDPLAYVLEITITIVVLVVMFLPREFGGSNSLYLLIIPILSWLILIISVFIRLHIQILRRILGENDKPSTA